MERYRFFWGTMERCNWTCEDDDNKVLAPVIRYLAGQGDSAIFRFDELMSELLYNLDTRKLAEQCLKGDRHMSGDMAICFYIPNV